MVVGAGRDEVGRVRGEDRVPHPALVVLQHLGSILMIEVVEVVL